MIHFLVCDATDLDGLDEWDPDAEPVRYADGEGHNLLELRQRLRATGRLVTVGSTVPRDATLVVFMPRPLLRQSGGRWFGLARKMSRHRVVALRSDLEMTRPLPIRTDLVVAPSQSFIKAFPQRSMKFLPLLVQRGLISREPSRGDQISVVGIKANPGGVSDWFKDPALVERLQQLGLKLDVDAPASSSGSDQSWHDFSGIDVAICARPEGRSTITKPATKLRNAWAAGVIPLASREPAYVEIGTDRHDVLFFDDPAEVPLLLGELRADAELRSRLWRGVAETAASMPSVADQVDQWWAVFLENERPPSHLRGVRSLVHFAGVQIPRVAGRFRRRVMGVLRP